MSHLAPLLFLLIVVVACDIRTPLPFPTPPSAAPEPTPLPTTPPLTTPLIPTIAVGEEVRGTSAGTELIFQVVAPADGQLVVWHPQLSAGLDSTLLKVPPAHNIRAVIPVPGRPARDLPAEQILRDRHSPGEQVGG